MGTAPGHSEEASPRLQLPALRCSPSPHQQGGRGKSEMWDYRKTAKKESLILTMTQHFSTSPYFFLLHPPPEILTRHVHSSPRSGGEAARVLASGGRANGGASGGDFRGSPSKGKLCWDTGESGSAVASTLLGHPDSLYHTESTRPAGVRPVSGVPRSPPG